MMDYPVSDELKTMLGRGGLRGATAATVKPGVMKWANEMLDREETDDELHSPSGGEEDRPNAMPRLRIVRARPFLAVIDGGR